MTSHPEVQAPPADFVVRVPLPMMMTTREELDLARLAVARDSASAEHRYRLAYILTMLDRFDEAIEVLRDLSTRVNEFRVFHLLGTALLARENAQDSLAARRTVSTAVAVAEDRHERSRALALLGKAHLRLAEPGEGRERLVEALDEDVTNKDAYKRLSMLDFLEHRDQQASDHAESLVAKGVRHARVLGVRPLAFARLGRLEEAHEAFGLEPFLHQRVLEPPPGWPTIEAFNRELAAELVAHPGIRYETYGLASTHSWRVNHPSLSRSRLVPELQKLLQREVSSYVARLSAGNDPFLLARPPRSFLHAWCVMADGDGYEEWHVHQNGWLSGAYYVDVPDFVAQGSGSEGCIAFGLPPGIVGEERHAQFDERLFRPRSGLCLLFPSHSFHRTYAHRGDRRRICFAFDVVPEP